jgi:hypothetical protein
MDLIYYSLNEAIIPGRKCILRVSLFELNYSVHTSNKKPTFANY